MAARAKAAHDWEMAAMVVSTWQSIDLRANPYRDRPKHDPGTFDTAALRREHNRRKKNTDA